MDERAAVSGQYPRSFSRSRRGASSAGCRIARPPESARKALSARPPPASRPPDPSSILHPPSSIVTSNPTQSCGGEPRRRRRLLPLALPARGLFPGGDVELPEDLLHVPLRPVGGDAQTLGDLGVGEALAQQLQHLELARREDVRVLRAAAFWHGCSLAKTARIYTTRPSGACQPISLSAVPASRPFLEASPLPEGRRNFAKVIRRAWSSPSARRTIAPEPPASTVSAKKGGPLLARKQRKVPSN